MKERTYTVKICPADCQTHTGLNGEMMEIWRNEDGKIHRDHGPAITVYAPDTGTVIGREWYRDGKVHREDGPALESHKPGKIKYVWWINGIIVRPGHGPAMYSVCPETGVIIGETWLVDQEMHREDGPAGIIRDPTTGNVIVEEWCRSDKLHRADGPAIVERDRLTGEITSERYFLEGKEVFPPGKEFTLDPGEGVR